MKVYHFQRHTIIHIAAKFGLGNILVGLLSCNVNIQNKEGDTPIHIAVRENKAATIFQLLAHQQCNPNFQNKVCDIPLHIACFKKLYDVIKLLLERKCNTNIPKKKGETAQDILLNGDLITEVQISVTEDGKLKSFSTHPGDI